ncbi:hypothetical protein FACS189463_0910 [Bacteroidia bacterium]|nr:hypothetical protein FACS189463_0910 [Bacteroidia bacterium]
MLGITNKISSMQYIVLFIASVLIPSFIAWVFGDGVAFLIHYWLFILFGYLTIKTNMKFMYVLFGYFLVSVFFFHSATLGERTFFSVNFLFTSACLYGLNKLDIDLERFNIRHIFINFFLFLFCYIISINVSGQTYDGRVYYDGFIIAHHYAYVAAFFGYFLILQQKTWIGIAVVLSGALVGTRSGLLVCAIPFIHLAKQYFNQSAGSKIQKAVLLSVICIIGLGATFFLFQKQITPTINTFKTLSVESIVENDEEELSDFSASRTILWALMFTQVEEDGFTLPNITGRGPASSKDFLEENFNARLWMHNDFLDIFFCWGALGVGIYIFCICCYYRQTKDIYFLLMLLIATLTNGFFPYIAIQFVALHLLAIKINKKQGISMSNVENNINII